MSCDMALSTGSLRKTATESFPSPSILLIGRGSRCAALRHPKQDEGEKGVEHGDVLEPTSCEGLDGGTGVADRDAQVVGVQHLGADVVNMSIGREGRVDAERGEPVCGVGGEGSRGADHGEQHPPGRRGGIGDAGQLRANSACRAG